MSTLAAHRGDLQQARAYKDEVVQMARQTRIEQQIARHLNQRGNLELQFGNYHEAFGFYQETLQYRLSANADVYWCYRNLIDLALVLHPLGHQREAARILAYILEINPPDNLDDFISNHRVKRTPDTRESLRGMFTDAEWQQGIADTKAANDTLESILQWAAHELTLENDTH